MEDDRLDRDVRNELRDAVSTLKRKRYPVLIALSILSQMRPKLWREVADECGLTFTDIVDDEAHPGLADALSSWEGFADWLRDYAIEHRGALFYEVDQHVTRWEDAQRQAFFLRLLHTEALDGATHMSIPIVVPSLLARQLELPENSRDFGCIMDIAE